MPNFTYFNTCDFICIWLQVINKVKFIHQGEGHIKVKVKYSTSLQILCSPYFLQVGDLHSTECVLVEVYVWFNFEIHVQIITHNYIKYGTCKFQKNSSNLTSSTNSKMENLECIYFPRSCMIKMNNVKG